MKEVNASIITIGDELLIGQTIDTNSAFISQELNKIGIWMKRRIAVGDIKEEILDALEQQSNDCDLIIITGGLGPTADDITKPALAEFFNSGIVINEKALQNVKNIFKRINKPIIERNLKQAEVPDNCIVLQNELGTAPGMWFSRRNSLGKEIIYISLPGVPHEMKGLMLQSVLPALKDHFELPFILHSTALLAGKGESEIAEIIQDFENALPPHIKLAYLPAYGMIRLRLTAKGENEDILQKDLGILFNELKNLVKEWLVADEDITLQQTLIKLLKEKEKTLSTAESCTGGYISHLVTSVPGSSAVFKGSMVSYDNDVKRDLLGVSPSTLDQFGAVSEQTVKEMVSGILKSLKTDYAIATSGIMGPDGGSPEKPVGMVWIAVGNSRQTKAQQFNFRFDRHRNIELTGNTALNMLRRFVLEEEGV
jgi:nicotinamide-nucleotide amidase